MDKSRRALSFTLLAMFATAGTAQSAKAASAGAIDADVNDALSRFYHHVHGSRQLVRNAMGVLVFPRVIKAGMGVGGEYGEGALRIRGRTVAYFNTISASFGFQLGAQARSVIILFMTDDALEQFRGTDGWKVGVDGSVAVITVGVGGSIDTNRIASPIVGFIFDGKGLMYNLTLEGSKISQIYR
jgi:lipid-binding SYLF domain-containing protein